MELAAVYLHQRYTIPGRCLNRNAFLFDCPDGGVSAESLSYTNLHGNLHPSGYYQEAGHGSNIFGRSLIHAQICNGIYTTSCMKRGITLDFNTSRGEMVGVLFYACFDKS